MLKLDVEATMAAVREAMLATVGQPGTDPLVYSPEGIDAMMAFTRWSLSMGEGVRSGAEVEAILNAAALIPAMPIANLLANLNPSPEEHTEMLHYVVQQFHRMLHRLERNETVDAAVDVVHVDVGDA